MNIRDVLDVVLVEMRDGLSTLTTPVSVECFRAQFAEPAMAAMAKPSIEMFEHFDDVIDIQGHSISIIHTSAGFYVYTPDDQPLIGPIPEVPGFYVNCGYWAGVMLSPEAGKRIADLFIGKLDSKDKSLRPRRFKEGLGKKDKTLMSH